MPNIEGKTNSVFITAGTKSSQGAFQSMEYSASGSYFGGSYTNNPNWNITANGGEQYTQIKIKASDNNSIYGNSSTVQPPAITINFYIKY